jgi:protein SCO1
MSTQIRSHTKLVTIILLSLAVIVAFVIYFGIVKNLPSRAEVKIDGVVLTTSKPIIDFQLTDNTGKPFTKANLKGHWTMMFFGFTNCGMVCPTTMASLNSMYKTLQKELPDSRLPNVVMVTVDPERDTIERMNEYVTTFNPNFVGARADMPMITALEKELHLVAVKMQAGEGKNQYTINHSSEIMVFNPAGELQAFMSYPHEPLKMVQDYKKILTIQTT